MRARTSLHQASLAATRSVSASLENKLDITWSHGGVRASGQGNRRWEMGVSNGRDSLSSSDLEVLGCRETPRAVGQKQERDENERSLGKTPWERGRD